MWPQTMEGWIFLIFTCAGGFFLGQWIRHRRKKSLAPHEPIIRIQQSRREKRAADRARRKAARG